MIVCNGITSFVVVLSMYFLMSISLSVKFVVINIHAQYLMVSFSEKQDVILGKIGSASLLVMIRSCDFS